MIYTQPVVQDLPRLRVPTLLVIGLADRTTGRSNHGHDGLLDYRSSSRTPRPVRRLALAFSTRSRNRGSFSSR